MTEQCPHLVDPDVPCVCPGVGVGGGPVHQVVYGRAPGFRKEDRGLSWEERMALFEADPITKMLRGETE